MPGQASYCPEPRRGLAVQAQDIHFVSPLIPAHEIRDSPLGGIRPVKFGQANELLYADRTRHRQISQMQVGGNHRRMGPPVTMVNYLHGPGNAAHARASSFTARTISSILRNNSLPFLEAGCPLVHSSQSMK